MERPTDLLIDDSFDVDRWAETVYDQLYDLDRFREDILGCEAIGDVENGLVRHPRFHIHFTPTGSSWVNQVAGLACITEKLIRCGVHPTVVDLEGDIRAWIDNGNEIPNSSPGPRTPTRSSTA
jgi:hypothetical protein